MFDAHCHIQFDALQSSVQGPLKRALDAGLFVCGADYDAAQRPRLRALASKHPNVVCCFGLHPWALEHATLLRQLSQVEDALAADAHQPWLVGVGETGLDFRRARAGAQRTMQLNALTYQLRLADRHDLPVVLHNVRAQEALTQKLGLYPNVSCLFHAFESSPEQAAQTLRLGGDAREVMLSFGPSLTRGVGRPAFEWVLQHCPEQWTFETDAPDRPVEGKQGVGEPLDVRAVAAAAQTATGRPAQALLEQAAGNAARFFGLPWPPAQATDAPS